MRNADAFPAANSRTRSSRSGSMGSGARFSHTKKAPRNAAPQSQGGNDLGTAPGGLARTYQPADEADDPGRDQCDPRQVETRRDAPGFPQESQRKEAGDRPDRDDATEKP